MVKLQKHAGEFFCLCSTSMWKIQITSLTSKLFNFLRYINISTLMGGISQQCCSDLSSLCCLCAMNLLKSCVWLPESIEVRSHFWCHRVRREHTFTCFYKTESWTCVTSFIRRNTNCYSSLSTSVYLMEMRLKPTPSTRHKTENTAQNPACSCSSLHHWSIGEWSS